MYKLYDYFKNLKTSSLIVVITSISLVSFLISIALIIYFQAQKQNRDQLKEALTKAHKFSSIHKDISFERSYNILSNYTNFAVFHENCFPIIVKDLEFTSKTCYQKNSKYDWSKIYLEGKLLLIGQKPLRSFSDYYEYASTTIQLSIVAHVIFSFLLAFFFYKIFIILPTKVMSHEIDSFLERDLKNKNFLFRTNKGLIFGKLYETINKMILKIENYQEKAIKHELSRQISHDLRVPIAIIKQEIENYDYFDLNSVKNGLKRMEEISDSLLSPTYNTKVEIDSLKSDIESICKAYNLDLIWNQSSAKNTFISKISESDIYRILSNLIKNSKEANANSINLSLLVDEGIITICVTDNGCGIENKKIQLIENGKFTDKDSGNGLGLSFVRTCISSIGGEIKLFNNSEDGLTVEMKFPISPLISLNSTVVLVDDDKYIGISWGSMAKRIGIKFCYFKGQKDLVDNLSTFSDRDAFFIDKNIGTDSGIELATLLSQKGFKNLYLASGETLNEILPEYLIGNVGKEFPAFLIKNIP